NGRGESCAKSPRIERLRLLTTGLSGGRLTGLSFCKMRARLLSGLVMVPAPRPPSSVWLPSESAAVDDDENGDRLGGCVLPLLPKGEFSCRSLEEIVEFGRGDFKCGDQRGLKHSSSACIIGDDRAAFICDGTWSFFRGVDIIEASLVVEPISKT
ncbi:hypothetical protein GGF41_008423, partial [Coemansia sp. RSA 2531]